MVDIMNSHHADPRALQRAQNAETQRMQRADRIWVEEKMIDIALDAQYVNNMIQACGMIITMRKCRGQTFPKYMEAFVK